jgi:BMFP domain-containing protein YqiC
LSLRGIEATNKRVEALERRVTELEARATGGVKGAMTEPAEAAHRNP